MGNEKNNTHRQVLILGSLDYETNVLPLHHGAREPFYIMLGIKAPIGIEPMFSGFYDHPLNLSRIELKKNGATYGIRTHADIFASKGS